MQQYVRKDELEQQWRERRALIYENVRKTLEEVRGRLVKALEPVEAQPVAVIEALDMFGETIYSLDEPFFWESDDEGGSDAVGRLRLLERRPEESAQECVERLYEENQRLYEDQEGNFVRSLKLGELHAVTKVVERQIHALEDRLYWYRGYDEQASDYANGDWDLTVGECLRRKFQKTPEEKR